MRQQLSLESLSSILQVKNIENISLAGMSALFRAEKGFENFLPDGICQVDPRTGDHILYSSARAKRPHDLAAKTSEILKPGETVKCPVCAGETTGVVDVAELSEGFTFINKNRFPILHPHAEGTDHHVYHPADRKLTPDAKIAVGLHFLQWTSSLHDVDWQNMSAEDRVIVMKRIAALEKGLLKDLSGILPETMNDDDPVPGYVSIIKNYGRLVGGSLAHGHQQIAFSNVMPRKIHDNYRFKKEHGEPFSAFLLRENPEELVVRDYGPAILVVPYFMRRPYDMILVVKDTNKRHLYQFDDEEIRAIADGWHDAIKAMLTIMPLIDREPAYNITVSNGPGAGIYFEFLPYTQETGGYEHMGLYICQGKTSHAAEQLRDIIKQNIHH